MNEYYDRCWEANVNGKVQEELKCLFPWDYQVPLSGLMTISISALQGPDLLVAC